MRVDVLALQRFYASPLGGLAQRMIQRRLQAVWPDLAGLDVLGFGYPLPWLAEGCAGARRVVAAMPAAQGAERWPLAARGKVALVDETRLPFMDALFDRVLLAHALEETPAAAALLRQLWRVMAPEGRLVVIAANRAGLWARLDSTPFGFGRPFSRNQLGALLRDSLFEPTATSRAVYAPPLEWGASLALADGLERTGELIWPAFGGVLLMEAVKRVHAAPAAAAASGVVRLSPRPQPSWANPAGREPGAAARSCRKRQGDIS